MDASARVTPNSVCTSGNTTDTTYMPLFPKSINSKVVSNRHAAWGESMAVSGAADCFTVFAMTNGFVKRKGFVMT
jgi:hypothetical protein